MHSFSDKPKTQESESTRAIFLSDCNVASDTILHKYIDCRKESETRELRTSTMPGVAAAALDIAMSCVQSSP